MIDYVNEASLALYAVSEASLLLMDKPDVIVANSKSKLNDLVTEWDLRIEKSILEKLRNSEFLIVSEEFNSNPDFKKGLPKLFWAIDPIDGTTNFVHGLPYYGISIGLVENGNFKIGAVAMPALKELFFTFGTTAAFCNGRLLKVADADLGNSLLAVSFSHSFEEDLDRKQFEILRLVHRKSRGVLRLGSAAGNICNVAVGKIQVAYGFNAKVWDVAGALAIAKHAGAKIWVRWNKTGLNLDYLVGQPTAVTELKSILDENQFSGWEPAE